MTTGRLSRLIMSSLSFTQKRETLIWFGKNIIMTIIMTTGRLLRSSYVIFVIYMKTEA